jgi:formylglycine-generating enzyme required for sulfatase activity
MNLDQDGSPPSDDAIGPGELAPGELVAERYRVAERIGEGGSGRVYLAEDLRLARRVAVKVLRLDRAEAGERARLQQEAEITAQFNHPNIVTIHDTGVYRGAPFLALEYIEGASLRVRLERGGITAVEALHIGGTLADALAYAHAKDVLHRDLKPENVLVPGDGRLRVLDFGLAIARQLPASHGASGSLAYMAPEQWQAAALTPAVDVWALGVVLHELLAGRHPYPRGSGFRPPAVTPSFRGLPAIADDLAQILDRCLAWTPSERPTARALATALSTADDALLRAQRADEDPPYRGLLAFDEASADRFFGREHEIVVLTSRLSDEPTLALVGPSGVGKSSLVHAGLLPRLRRDGGWIVLQLRPGRSPFRALARALAVELAALGPAPDEITIAERLAQELGYGRRLLLELATRSDRKILVFVDQLEEVFTYGEDAAARQRFVDVVLRAATDALEPVRVVVTIRDDFVGRISALERVLVVAPLAHDNLLRALCEPLERSGYRFDAPEVIARMVTEASADLGALPVLQFACALLWDARDRQARVLPARAFDARGGIGRALAAHADGVLDALAPAELRVARGLLLALVSVEHTKVLLSVESARAALGPDVERVAQTLVDARLMVLRRGRPHGEAAYELAHESLISRWDRLRQWLEELDADRLATARLLRMAQAWRDRGATDEGAAGVREVDELRKLAHTAEGGLPQLLLDFGRAGESKLRRGRRRRVAATTGGMTLLLALSIGALVVARDARERQLAAERQAEDLRLAGANMGAFDLVLAPFDWDGTQAVDVDAHELPELRWTLHRLANTAEPRPGEPMLPQQVHRGAATITARGERVERVEAAGMGAFLRVEGRGRAGQSCAPSWLPIRSLPGYAERTSTTTPTLRVQVPTCQVTNYGLIEVPRGPYIAGGAGEPRVAPPGSFSAEHVAEVRAYALDRTEVSNAQYRVFARHAAVSGIAGPRYPVDGVLADSGRPDHPVTSLNVYEAERYCEYLGKRLPTVHEWTKAARGGLTLDRAGLATNPSPRRAFPWGPVQDQLRANVARERREPRATMPVDSLEAGMGPYGHLHLVGNVREWMAADATTAPLRPIRGGGWSSPQDSMEYTTSFENVRDPKYFDFSLGVRCATSPPTIEP